MNEDVWEIPIYFDYFIMRAFWKFFQNWPDAQFGLQSNKQAKNIF